MAYIQKKLSFGVKNEQIETKLTKKQTRASLKNQLEMAEILLNEYKN